MLSSSVRKAGPYTGTGVILTFPFKFKVFAPADVQVYVTSTAGVETVQTTGYTVFLNSNQDTSPGGSVVFDNPPASGVLVTLTSNITATQPMQLTNGGGFFPRVLNDSADRITAVLQQIKERSDRSLSAPISSNEPLNGLALPSAAQRAGKLLAFDINGAIVPISSAAGGPGDTGLRTELAQTQGGRLAGYVRSGLSLLRSVGDWLDDQSVSVTEFMTFAQAFNCRARLATIEVTAAFNAAFAYAQARGITVIIPDGVFLVGNLFFGSQNTAGQSPAPAGLVGRGKQASILKAKPGLTGTVLQSWSVAGITFRDFAIFTGGSSAVAWDCRWRPGDPNRAGPSTQCVIEHMIFDVHDNFTDGQTAHVNLDDMNDTYPLGLTIRPNGVTTYTNCYLSMIQSGGQTAMTGCIWTGGFLKFGCQIGEINHSWGHGILFANGCLNHVTQNAGYMYGNPVWKTVYKSENMTQNAGMKGLTLVSTELNSAVPEAGITSYFELNLFGELHLINCEFLDRAPNLFGPTMRGDGGSPALCKIEGGTHIGLTDAGLQDCPNGQRVEVECEGFRDNVTGLMVTKNRGGSFAPVIRSAASVGTFTPGGATYGRVHRKGNIAHFKIRVDWTGHTTPGATATVTGFPLDRDTNGVESAVLEFADPNFAGARASFSGNQVVFYKADNTLVALAATGSVILSGFYSVKA